MIELANVGNFRAVEDWAYLLPAILFVDVIFIFLSRFFPSRFGKPINDWYDEFGLAAVLSDVSIIAIAIAISRYLYSYFFMEKEGWHMSYFLGLSVVVQLVHDIAFAYGVVMPIPKGVNSMIDVFKEYVKAGPVILFVDSLMIVGSILIGAALKNQDAHYTVSGSLLTVYALTYILYTNVDLRKPLPQD
jgi:hypothetical protein